MIHVFIYDDNKARRESLLALIELSSHIQSVGYSSNCSNLIQDMTKANPDIVLMDIEMPEVNGIEGVRMMRENFPEIKVVMQTVYEDADKIFQCLQHGAKGYILKKASAKQIIDCIEEVQNGGAFMTPSIAMKVVSYFQQHNHSSELEKLSPKEKEVLDYLAEGLSYKLIADKMSITPGTVNNHLKKVYQKLQVNSAGEAISLLYKLKMK